MITKDFAKPRGQLTANVGTVWVSSDKYASRQMPKNFKWGHKSGNTVP